MLRIPEEHLLSKVSKIQWRASVARHTACVLCYQSRLLLLPRQGIHDEPCCRRHKAWTILAVCTEWYCLKIDLIGHCRTRICYQLVTRNALQEAAGADHCHVLRLAGTHARPRPPQPTM